jgi:HD-like signal output (HDOD) protein
VGFLIVQDIAVVLAMMAMSALRRRGRTADRRSTVAGLLLRCGSAPPRGCSYSC